MAAIKRIKGTINTQQGGGIRQGVGIPAFIAPLDAGASVGAEEVKQLSRISDVADEFGDSSDQHEAAKAALPQLGSALFVAVDDFEDENGDSGPYTETITGTDTAGVIGDIDDDGTSERLPLTDVTDVQVDSSALAGAILFTHQDPSTFAVGTDDILINPITGKYELGSAPTTDVEFTYEVHDWDGVLDLLDASYEYESHIYANHTFNANNIGVYDHLITHGESQRKTIITVLDSGPDPATLDQPDSAPGEPTEGLVEDNYSHVLMIHSTHFSAGDATSAYAARVLVEPTNGSMTEQEAPDTITFEAKTFTEPEIGDPENPAAGTFLNVGVVPTYRDRGERFMAADRAAQPLTEDFYRNFSTVRVLFETLEKIDRNILALRRSSSTAIPFNGDGQIALKGAIKEVLDDQAAEGKLDPTSITELVVPPASDLSDADKVSRIWSGIEVPISIVGQGEVFLYDANARLA